MKLLKILSTFMFMEMEMTIIYTICLTKIIRYGKTHKVEIKTVGVTLTFVQFETKKSHVNAEGCIFPVGTL